MPELEKILVSFDEYIDIDLEKSMRDVIPNIDQTYKTEYHFRPTRVFDSNYKTYKMTNFEEFEDFIDTILLENNFLQDHRNLIEEIASNALEHGNNYDPSLTIKLEVVKGNKGWLLSVEDSGYGFNFRNTLKTGTFTNEGKGLRLLKETCAENPKMSFSYEGNGQKINLYTL